MAVPVQIRQFFPQLRAREGEMRADRPLAQSRHRRDLPMLELLDQMQPRDDGLHFRQLVQRILDAPRDLIRSRRKIGVITPRRRLTLRDLLVFDAPAVLQNVEREVGGNAKDPGSERLAELERLWSD